ncbi:MAG: T9SS type A sorting domain-containing protein [bacterium]|nr:T9SS type A sorting domain-containing protein [bacterium]
MMKAILCLAMVIWSMSIVHAQPLILEWERTLTISNDSLYGLVPMGTAEDPYSNRLFVFGAAMSRGASEVDDSSDAYIACLSPEGDSLWTRVYDGANVNDFQRAAFYPNGDILVAGNDFWHYRLDSLGGYISSFRHNRGGIGWALWDLDILPNGNILTAGEVVNDVGFLARLYCSSPSGDSLWSMTFSGGQFTYIQSVQPLGNGHIALWARDGGVNRLLVLSDAGDIAREIDEESPEDVYYYPNGEFVLLSSLGAESYVVSRRDADNHVIDDFLVQDDFGGFVRMLPAITGGFLLYDYSHVVKLTETGEIEWSQQVELTRNGVALCDGYLTLYGQKYSVEAPYPIVSRDSLNFGTIRHGDFAIRGFELTNAGPDSFRIDSLVFPDGFWSDFLDNEWVTHRELIGIQITFLPESAELYEGDLLVYNTTQWSPLVVHLTGDARTSEVRFDEPVAAEFNLAPPYPNPFNPSTTLTFAVAHESDIQLNVFDIQGRLVGEVVHGSFAAGQHSVNWSCAECASGIYFATMNAGSFTASQKLLLLK